MTTGKSDLIDVECNLIAETADAIKVQPIDIGNKAAWLPKSQIEFELRSGDSRSFLRLIVVTMPEWLALDKELI